MRVLIDACVLVPSLTRRLVLAAGEITPLWSAGILDEWRYAVSKLGPMEAAEVGTEIALMRAKYMQAEIAVRADQIDAINLPDPDDCHVLAAALAGQAEELLTFNIKDFPLRVLAGHGILRRQPDEFLLEAAHADAAPLTKILEAEEAATCRSRRALLRGSQLPRLSKFLTV
jgi:predicted nucleic acid-binding protein